MPHSVLCKIQMPRCRTAALPRIKKKPSSDGHVHSRKNGGALIICCKDRHFLLIFQILEQQIQKSFSVFSLSLRKKFVSLPSEREGPDLAEEALCSKLADGNLGNFQLQELK